jgi:hypothetical protein
VCTGGPDFGLFTFGLFTFLRTVSKATRDATQVPLRPSRTAVPTHCSGGALGSTAQRSTARRSKAGRRRGTAQSGRCSGVQLFEIGVKFISRFGGIRLVCAILRDGGKYPVLAFAVMGRCRVRQPVPRTSPLCPPQSDDSWGLIRLLIHPLVVLLEEPEKGRPHWVRRVLDVKDDLLVLFRRVVFLGLIALYATVWVFCVYVCVSACVCARDMPTPTREGTRGSQQGCVEG